MISNGIESFRGKQVLLLQGPIGPFFRRLSRDLESVGATVFKINFNGGDWLFYPNRAIPYRGTLAAWPAFFEETVELLSIDIVLLFGDCRPVHKSIKPILSSRRIPVGVFEEGYIRPNYITLELNGTNAHSSLPRDPEYYFAKPLLDIPQPEKVGNTYNVMAACAILYYTASAFLNAQFPQYRHHRPLTLNEAFPWLRSAWRKYSFARKEKGLQEQLITSLSGNYYLVPLQVHSDSQLFSHSNFDSVQHFIEQVVSSFRQHAPIGTVLVIKHHPMDRGYYDYTALISELSEKHGLHNRLIYLHDQHLPTLLRHARGVVVINSTVGLSALYHGMPLKVCGKALYDMEGLTFQGSLDMFWQQATSAKPNRDLVRRFRATLVAQTQLNGSFYKRLQGRREGTGLIWALNGRSAVAPELSNPLSPHPLIKRPLAQLGAISGKLLSSKLLSNRLFLLTVLVPTLVSIIYFGLIKSDVYVSESHFIIRAPQKNIPTGIDAVLQGVGFNNSGDDTHSIHDYMQSRDAATGVDKRLDLRRAFGGSGIDIFSRFNPLGFNDSFEELYRHYQRHISVYMSASSSISVLKVKAYNAEDAYRINELLLSKGEGLINQLNERGRKDLIQHAQAEVELGEKKAKDASIKLAAFRNRYGVVDPLNQSALQLQQVSALQNEYVATKTRLAQVVKFTPKSPQIPTLQNILATLDAEIQLETGKVAGSDPSLANRAVEYERLLLDQKFAEKQLAAAMTALEQARSEADRKQLYLERIVQPNKPDIAIEPLRGRAVLSTLLVGLLAWGILSMLIAGVKEHLD